MTTDKLGRGRGEPEIKEFARNMMIVGLGLSKELTSDLMSRIIRSGELGKMKSHIRSFESDPYNKFILGINIKKETMKNGNSKENSKENEKDEKKEEKKVIEKNPIKESFLQYLLKEVTITLDTEDPDAFKKFKQAKLRGKSSPSIVAKQELEKATSGVEQAKTSSNPEDEREAKARLLAARSQRRSVIKTKRPM